jgi:hypothetical protein
MPEERDIKKRYEWKLIVSRPVERPKMKDIQATKIVIWKRCTGSK